MTGIWSLAKIHILLDTWSKPGEDSGFSAGFSARLVLLAAVRLRDATTN
jgi:hypothetical protein